MFPDETTAVAAVDRLVHHTTILEMNVESYRRREALDNRGKRKAGRPASYAASDVVVSASVRPESFGRVLAEAGAMDLPVVSSDLGAAHEIVRHGETGWLVPPGDPGALAQGIRKVLFAAGPALAAKARAHVLAHFTRDLMCAKTLAVYRELL